MIHFIDSARDGELIAELRDEGVLARDVIALIDESMGRPESGTLNDFLLAGADFIPEKAWLSWLIRRYGCHRFGHVWHGWMRPLDGRAAGCHQRSICRFGAAQTAEFSWPSCVRTACKPPSDG